MVNTRSHYRIVTAEVEDGAVTTAKLNDGAVTTPKIADGNVTTAKVNDNAVDATKISTGAVTTNRVANFLSGLTVPDTSTFFSFDYQISPAPSTSMVQETTAGVMGYVQQDDISETGVTLVANTSGVTCNVLVIK